MRTMVAFDPSMTAFGWAAVALTPEGPKLIAAGVTETAVTPAKRRKAEGISLASDSMRRVRYLRRELARVLAAHGPHFLAVEEKVGGGAGGKGVKAAESNAAAQSVAACVIDEYLGDGQPLYVTVAEASAATGVGPTQRIAKQRPGKGERSSAPLDPKLIEAELQVVRRALEHEDATDETRDVLRERVERLEAQLAVGKEQQRASAKARDARRDARKAAIAEAVLERYGLYAWLDALGLTDVPLEDARDAVLDPRFEGAHDAAAVALAAWERPEVAALRRIASEVA